MADPYQTLGVTRSATQGEIKSAYRQLAKQLHPDRHPDDPTAADRFGTVTAAYDLLSDTDKRARFDRGEIDADGNPVNPFAGGFGGATGAGGGRGGFDFGSDFNQAGAADLGDIFEGLFGGRAEAAGARRQTRSAPPPKGANVAYRLLVSFTDAATRMEQRITLADGSTVALKLPAGVEDGTTLRLAGKGQPGPGGNGDAQVTIEVGRHPHFTRDGDDIRLDLPISLTEAVQGAKVRCPTVDGAVMVTVPPNSSSGRTLRLRGKGWTTKAAARGDQFVQLMIELPVNDADLARFVADWPGGDGESLRGDLA